MAICAELHSDETEPEFMFQDYQGFPASMYCESSAKEIFNVLEYVKENDITAPIEAVFAYIGNGCSLSSFEDAYQGEWESERDFSDQLFDELYLHEVPQSIRYYIDYDAFCRDLFINDYNYIDGYVFQNI